MDLMQISENIRFSRLIKNLNQTIKNRIVHNKFNQLRFPCYNCTYHFKSDYIRESVCNNCLNGNDFTNYIFGEELYGPQDDFPIEFE